MKINDFKQSLKDGLKGEDKTRELLSDFYPFLYDRAILHSIFEETPEIQKSGVDFIIKPPEIKIDVKVTSRKYYHFKNILLETKVGNNNGWFYTSNSDIILWLWWADENKEKFVDGYVILLKKLRLHCEIYDVFNKNNRNIHPIRSKTERGDRTWITTCYTIPITLLEIWGCISKINKDYNAIMRKWFI